MKQWLLDEGVEAQATLEDPFWSWCVWTVERAVNRKQYTVSQLCGYWGILPPEDCNELWEILDEDSVSGRHTSFDRFGPSPARQPSRQRRWWPRMNGSSTHQAASAVASHQSRTHQAECRHQKPSFPPTGVKLSDFYEGASPSASAADLTASHRAMMHDRSSGSLDMSPPTNIAALRGHNGNAYSNRHTNRQAVEYAEQGLDNSFCWHRQTRATTARFSSSNQ